MLDPWLLKKLACPRDHSPLREEGTTLCCESGHRYPVVSGIPIFLLEDVPQTIALADASLHAPESQKTSDSLHIDTLGLSDEEKRGVLELSQQPNQKIDPVASYLVAATNGIMYKHLIGRLDEYPIPELRLPPGAGRTLLDIGCSWGRWSIAAARKGYQSVGLDPSLGAVLAAQRVAQQLGVTFHGVVGDARYLPFAPTTFDTVFSYSVLQHFSREDVNTALASASNVVTSKGEVLIQMPNAWGVRCLYHQARRGFKEGRNFDVRYWTLGALREIFERNIGPVSISVDCFFGIGLQPSDYPIMPTSKKLVLKCSNGLCTLSRWLPLRFVADSVYVHACKP